MSELLGTWYFPHLLQEDPRVEYIKFKENDEYIYNDGLGRIESTYKLNSDSVVIKQPSSKEIIYKFEVSQVNNKTYLKLSAPEKGTTFTLVKAEGNKL